MNAEAAEIRMFPDDLSEIAVLGTPSQQDKENIPMFPMSQSTIQQLNQDECS